MLLRTFLGARTNPWERATLWSEVERQASLMAEREPFLRPLLYESVLCHDAPAGIVAAVLSRRLSPGRVRDASLHALVADTVRDDPAMLASLEADLAAVATRDPACRSPLHALLHLKGFQALQAHRVAHSLWSRGRHDVAHWLASQVSVVLGVDIHPAVPIGERVLLDHATGIVIGETAVVESDVTLLQGVTLGATGKTSGDRHPKVRRGALVGAAAMVLGSVEVGRMSKVAAGSVVVHDVPAHATVAGVPARVVRVRLPESLAA